MCETVQQMFVAEINTDEMFLLFIKERDDRCTEIKG